MEGVSVHKSTMIGGLEVWLKQWNTYLASGEVLSSNPSTVKNFKKVHGWQKYI
jgi:hypothetical protein